MDEKCRCFVRDRRRLFMRAECGFASMFDGFGCRIADCSSRGYLRDETACVQLPAGISRMAVRSFQRCCVDSDWSDGY